MECARQPAWEMKELTLEMDVDMPSAVLLMVQGANYANCFLLLNIWFGIALHPECAVFFGECL